MKRYGMMKAIEKKDITMKELAEIMDMNYKSLYRIQAGHATSTKTLERLAEKLDCDIKELL